MKEKRKPFAATYRCEPCRNTSNHYFFDSKPESVPCMGCDGQAILVTKLEGHKGPGRRKA